MADPIRVRSWSKLSGVVAAVLLTLFALQWAFSVMGMTPLFQRLPIIGSMVHAVDLAAFAGLTILSLWAANGRLKILVPVALLIAAIGIVLTAFNFASFLAIQYHQRVMPLPAVATFYCNQDSIRHCIGPYPGIALAIAVAWLSWAALIVVAAGALSAFSLRALRPLTFGGRAPRLPALLIAACVLLWGAIWVSRFDELYGTEPLTRFVMKSPLGPQPRELSTIPRPDYRVVPTPSRKPRLLVLITIDSLRADAVSLAPGLPSRTPFLQSLAAGGLLHDEGPAVAICSTSYCGITGVLTSSDWATLQKGPPLTIADVLAANGYTNHYLLSGPHLRVLNMAALYGPHVQTMLDDSSPDSSGLIDDREQVRRLRNLKLADPAHSFVFIHLMSAHAAGLRFDLDPAPPTLWKRLFHPPHVTGPYTDFYDRGVRQSDLIVRQLFSALQSRSLLDDALVIITADHGERLVGDVGHGGGVDLSTAMVPLLVYDPRRGSWPSIGKGMPSQIDIAPTLIAAAGIAEPEQWQGRALQSGVTRLAAPSDAQRETALVGRTNGQTAMVRCDVTSGRMGVLGVKADARTTAAQWGGWSRLPPRNDRGRCPV